MRMFHSEKLGLGFEIFISEKREEKSAHREKGFFTFTMSKKKLLLYS